MRFTTTSMHSLVVILLAAAIRASVQFAHGTAGTIFPIPLITSTEDPHFHHCPEENGVYAHTTNCSLFHVCTDRIHKIYTCIDGYFFNPSHARCQYVPTDNEVQCDAILRKMTSIHIIPLVNVISDTHEFTNENFDHRRKSAASKCVHTGIYPDRLDCSLFHYCRENQRHEVLKCPDELHFDPKTFLCAAPELIDCQYEPVAQMEENIDHLCRDHPSGTYLPVINRSDMYVICANDGRSILKRCPSGLLYNALTTACEKGLCTFDSTLCQNEGQCVDEPTIGKGFKCVCAEPFQGEYCENVADYGETEQPSSSNLFHRNKFEETTHIPYTKIRYQSPENQSAIVNNNSDHRVQDESSLNSSLEQHSQQWIQTVFMIAVIFIGIVLVGSIIFGIGIFIRVILHSPMESIGEWKALREESII